MLKSLNDTQVDGLVPQDFRIGELEQARLALQATAPTPAQSAAFDIAATRTYITALLQLRRGKVDPSRLDFHWNFDPVGVDPREDMNSFFAALDAHDVARAFAQAPPQETVYRSMRESLAQLRKVRDAGGWPKVAEGQSLKPGMDDAAVAQLRARLVAAGYLDPPKGKRTDYDDSVIAAVKKYQTEQYLGADGVAGETTLAALNVPVEARIDQVRVNMERARWLLYKLQGTFVIVDIAGYKVALYRDGQPIWRSRVQVGKPFRSTPVFQSEITYVTFNPTWTVPPTILVKDMLPKIQQNPGYLAANRIRALDRARQRARSVNRRLVQREGHYLAPGRRPRKLARAGGDSVPQRLCDLPPRYAAPRAVRQVRARHQFRLHPGGESVATGRVAVQRPGALE